MLFGIAYERVEDQSRGQAQLKSVQTNRIRIDSTWLVLKLRLQDETNTKSQLVTRQLLSG